MIHGFGCAGVTSQYYTHNTMIHYRTRILWVLCLTLLPPKNTTICIKTASIVNSIGTAFYLMPIQTLPSGINLKRVTKK